MAAGRRCATPCCRLLLSVRVGLAEGAVALQAIGREWGALAARWRVAVSVVVEASVVVVVVVVRQALVGEKEERKASLLQLPRRRAGVGRAGKGARYQPASHPAPMLLGSPENGG
jgi:hypothetical protein